MKGAKLFFFGAALVLFLNSAAAESIEVIGEGGGGAVEKEPLYSFRLEPASPVEGKEVTVVFEISSRLFSRGLKKTSEAAVNGNMIQAEIESIGTGKHCATTAEYRAPYTETLRFNVGALKGQGYSFRVLHKLVKNNCDEARTKTVEENLYEFDFIVERKITSTAAVGEVKVSGGENSTGFTSVESGTEGSEQQGKASGGGFVASVSKAWGGKVSVLLPAGKPAISGVGWGGSGVAAGGGGKPLPVEEVRKKVIASAKHITVTEYCSYGDVFCKKFHSTTFNELMQEYGDLFEYMFVFFPLKETESDYLAAQAAECAKQQEKFPEMQEKLFASGQAIGSALAKSFAEELGLDSTRFALCLDSGNHLEALKAGRDKVFELQLIAGTPTFFVNDYRIAGNAPVGKFAEAFAAIASGEEQPVPENGAPQRRENFSFKMCTEASGGGMECAAVTSIAVNPAAGEKEGGEEAAPAAVKPIEVELPLGGGKEKIKISKKSAESIELEDSKGKRAEVSDEILIDEEGFKVKNKPVGLLPNTAMNAVEKVFGAVEEKNIRLKVLEEKPVYEISAVKNAVFLWVFPLQMEIKAEVNAQTGGVKRIEKPWWSFLVG